MNDAIKRILVALDESAHSRAALEAAATLAARLDAELLGLFVQDMQLVQLARLPFAREVGLTSAESRAINPRSMELTLNAQAQKAKTAFESAALRHGLQCSFRVARGHIVTELLAASAEVDLLALGTSGHMEIAGRRLGSTVRGIVTGASCSVLIEQHTKRPGAALLLLYEDTSASADRALLRAEQFAASRGGELVIVLTGDATTRERLRDHVDRTRRRDTHVRIVALDDGVSALRTLTVQQDCGLLMMAHDSPLLAREPDLLGELVMPILLVR